MEKEASGHGVPASGAFLFPFVILSQLSSFFLCQHSPLLFQHPPETLGTV